MWSHAFARLTGTQSRTLRRRLVRAAALGAMALALTCDSPPRPTPIDRPQLPPPMGSGEAVLVGAGDIGWCGSSGHEATARLLDGIPGTVFTTGDNAYMSGTAQQFADCYEPTWGRHKARTRPSPGNHDYETPGAAPYFAYFGPSAGPAGRGYYSYDLGEWHILALNSAIAAGPGSPQLAWLRADLEASRARCAVAYWHNPVFSSGPNGSQSPMRDVWRVLQEFGVDVALAGDDHDYERFAPQDANGRFDPDRGIRQFVVGTGGAPLYEFASPRPNSEFRASVWGVLKLTLKTDAYGWDFIAVSGVVIDAGSGPCH